jgi:hypothetical protein
VADLDALLKALSFPGSHARMHVVNENDPEAWAGEGCLRKGFGGKGASEEGSCGCQGRGARGGRVRGGERQSASSLGPVPGPAHPTTSKLATYPPTGSSQVKRHLAKPQEKLLAVAPRAQNADTEYAGLVARVLVQATALVGECST